MSCLRPYCLAGIASLALGVLTIAASLIANPWFSVWRGALSDLGRVGLSTAWIFNSGLIASSITASTYVYCLIKSFRKSVTMVSAGIYLTAVAHLTLIAVFPEGTPQHWTLSYEFFLMMYAVYAAFTASLAAEGLGRHALLSASALAAGLIPSVIIEWPSTALLEIYNIAVMGYWYAVMLHATIKVNECVEG